MSREVIDIIIQERGGRKVAGSVRNIGTAATASAGGVTLLRNALRGLGVGVAVREVLRAIDSYQRMQNQLRVVGYEQGQLNKAMEDLFNIAQKTRTPLESTVGLYGKLAQSAGELGKSQGEMLKFTELVGKSLAIQGTSTAGARAALLQLSQAMGEGIVRAQEYNSLIENARPLLVAAAKGMDGAGGSVAKLRTLVLEGKVTSTEFFEAVLRGGEILDEQFGATVSTIGQALTVLNNAWTKFIGESAIGQTILAAVSGTLIFLANNFETLATFVIATGVAITGYIGGGILGALISRTFAAATAQIALAGGFSAASVAALVATAGIRAVTGSVWLLTAAIAANPLGAMAVAATVLATFLYRSRDALVTVGQATASLGSIAAEVWTRIKDYVVTFAQDVVTFVGGAYDSVVGYFGGWADEARATVNFLIAVFKSFVDVTTGNFKALYTYGVSILRNLAAIGGNIMSGFSSALSGDFSGAGEAFKNAFSGTTTVVVDAAAAAAAVLKDTAATVGENFGRDFIAEAGGALESGKAAFANTFEGLVADAAKRDTKIPVDEFEFIAPPGKVPPGGGGGGGGGGGKGEQSAFQKEYKKLVDETTGALETLTAQQQALDAAFANGVINQDQYIVKQQEIRSGLAEWAYEGQNAAEALRETNEAILEMKINAGDGTFADGFLLGLSRMTEGAANFSAQSGQIFADYFSSLSEGIANSIGRAIVYSEDLGEALSNVAKEALAGLISAFVKLGIQWLINAAIGKTLSASATAATAAQAGAAASAWAPAAALASLATSGANAAPAAAAIASTTAVSTSVAAASRIGGFASGGEVRGPGGPRDDSILAYLSNKEFVVNAKSAQDNLPLLQAINSGLDMKRVMPAFAEGGQALLRASAAGGAKRLAQAAQRDERNTRNSSGNNEPQTGQQASPDQNFVFLQDPGLVGQYMQTPDGREAVVKILAEEGAI